MCNFYTGCVFYAIECKNCCKTKILHSYKLNKEIKKAWIFLYDEYNKILSNSDEGVYIDTRMHIISSYVLVPSIFHGSIRILFLEYFRMKGVDTSILERGKWLPIDMNINKKLIESIFVSQNIHFSEMNLHMDALDFFTKGDQVLHRNKAAHNATDAIQEASRIMLKDIFKKFVTLMHGVVCFERIILKI